MARDKDRAVRTDNASALSDVRFTYVATIRDNAGQNVGLPKWAQNGAQSSLGLE